MSGKWHLGVREDCRPSEHGFESWFGFLAGCVDYFSHIMYWGDRDPLHDLWDEGTEVFDNGRYLTDMITERAVSSIRAGIRSGQPFFTYVAYNAPHYPMHAPRAYLDRFPDLPPERRIMAAMIAAVDDGVGSIIAELERAGVRDNTLVVFCSDNGPSRETRNWLDGTATPYQGGSTGELKGHKFSLYEGGIRVPGIISWPDRIPGGQVVDESCCGIDVLPTVMAAAGVDVAGLEIDGANLMPLLGDGARLGERQIFWELGAQTAVREGRWKLVLQGQLVEGVDSDDAVFLADLEVDPGERVNLAASYPEVAARLSRDANAWRQGIEDRWDQEWSPAAQGTTALGEAE